MKIIVINGPNLNLLGEREPHIYSNESLAEIMEWLRHQPVAQKVHLSWIQSNHEGALIDYIHEAKSKFDGILINPGALAHYSFSLRDAIVAVGLPTVEVHLSDIATREEFRKTSVIRDVCVGYIAGLGKNSYAEGLRLLLENLKT